MRARHIWWLLACLGAAGLFWPVGEARLHRFYPLRLFSREQILLKEFTNSAGAYGSLLPLDKCPVNLVQAVLQAEDRRFYYHPGFDPVAIARAAWVNLRGGKISSGASTITQQLARIVYHDWMPRNRYLRKVLEIMLSVKLSLTVSKDRLLEAYLNQVPLPLNSSGIEAAAVRIFGKHPQLLSDEEVIALAVMISRQQFTRPSFLAGVKSLWPRVFTNRPFSAGEFSKQLTAVKPLSRQAAADSRHFIQWLQENEIPPAGSLQSEVSARLNEETMRIVRNEMPALKPQGAEHAAVVILETGAGPADILRAMTGSADFGEEKTGEINHAVRIRSAGSTLKPFVYALGFDEGLFGAATVFSDSEQAFATGSENATYRPHNNDMRYWGTMTLRESLVASRNVPAVAAVNAVGVSRFLRLLQRSGMRHLTESADYYGPGLALGSGGTTLLHLARMYSALAHDGQMRPLLLGRFQEREIRIGESVRIMQPETADRLRHMLHDRPLRRRSFGARNFLDFPFPVAAKTGTSKDYRDGWVAGFIPGYTVAVWVGNSSGRPMQSVSGAWGAGRIFHQVIRLLAGHRRQSFAYRSSLREVYICRRSGKIAQAMCPAHKELIAVSEKTPPDCPLQHVGADQQTAGEYPQLLSPAPGERFILHPGESSKRQQIPILARLPAGRTYGYALNGEPRRPLTGRDFRELKSGDYTLRLFEGATPVEEVEFSVR